MQQFPRVRSRLHLFSCRLFRVNLTQLFLGRLFFPGGYTVPVYRFYIFEKEGHIISLPPTICNLPNDAAALKHAKMIIDDRAIEIWRYTSKIGRLNPRGSRKIAREVGTGAQA